jgi:hypothetical protein
VTAVYFKGGSRRFACWDWRNTCQDKNRTGNLHNALLTIWWVTNEVGRKQNVPRSDNCRSTRRDVPETDGHAVTASGLAAAQRNDSSGNTAAVVPLFRTCPSERGRQTNVWQTTLTAAKYIRTQKQATELDTSACYLQLLLLDACLFNGDVCAGRQLTGRQFYFRHHGAWGIGRNPTLY